MLLLDKYTCVNDEKMNRAIFGVIGRGGSLQGGVGESASDEEKIAEYDRLGGLILSGKHKVKTGSFYDFEKKTARKEPEVLLVFRDIEDNIVEIPEGESLPVEVRAAQEAKARSAAKKNGKKAKKNEDAEDDE